MPKATLPKRRMFKTPEESFAYRTARQGDCLIWTGAVKDTGYGAFWDGKRVIRPHRWNYERHYGPIPDGMDIDHICGNPLCCEPTHLRAGSRKLNMENRIGLNSNNPSGYRGVQWSTRDKKWRARVKHNYREYSAGHHDTAEAANAAAIALRNKLFKFNNRDRTPS